MCPSQPLPLILTNPANGDHLVAFVMGAAEGPNRPSLYLPMGDLMGVRNIQGGTAGRGGNLNLDIGAGSTTNPGDIVCNWDVGKRTRIYNGRKKLIADFSPGGIDFYVPVRFHKGARGI